MQLIDRASVDSLKTKNLEKKIEPFQWGKSTLVVFPPAVLSAAPTRAFTVGLHLTRLQNWALCNRYHSE